MVADGVREIEHAAALDVEPMASGGFEDGDAFVGVVAPDNLARTRRRGDDGVWIGGKVDVVEGEARIGAEGVAQRDCGDRSRKVGRARPGKVGDVGDDVGVARVAGVVVLRPAGGADVDFDVSYDATSLRPEEEDGVDEVGAGLKVPSAAGFDFDRLASIGGEFGGTEGCVVPDALQVALGPAAPGAVVGRGLAQFEVVRKQSGVFRGVRILIGRMHCTSSIFHFQFSIFNF